jgi:hypothetical protein
MILKISAASRPPDYCQIFRPAWRQSSSEKGLRCIEPYSVKQSVSVNIRVAYLWVWDSLGMLTSARQWLVWNPGRRLMRYREWCQADAWIHVLFWYVRGGMWGTNTRVYNNGGSEDSGYRLPLLYCLVEWAMKRGRRWNPVHFCRLSGRIIILVLMIVS